MNSTKDDMNLMKITNKEMIIERLSNDGDLRTFSDEFEYEKYTIDAEDDLGFYQQATEWLLKRVSFEREIRETDRRTICHVVGGKVENNPTNPINYLQRLRELVDKEKSYDTQNK